MAGTLFADRERRSQVTQLNGEMRAVLDQGALVILFPEGTSSDGRTVLPFKSSLFAPVIGCAQPVSASSIRYRLEDGDAGEEVCYWKDMTLVPHLVNLLSKRGVHACVRFSEHAYRGAERKSLARLLHAEVLRLKQELANHPADGVQVQIGELQPCDADA